MRLSAFLMSALCLALLFSKICYAGPPFFTDDPVPVERKHTEIYFASTFVSEKGGISGNLPMIDMNYGILQDIHAHVTTLFNYNHDKGEPEGEDPVEDPKEGHSPPVGVKPGIHDEGLQWGLRVPPGGRDALDDRLQEIWLPGPLLGDRKSVV